MRLDWFHAVAQRLSDPVLLMSREGTVRACNQAAIRLLGNEILGNNLHDAAADPAAFRRYLEFASRSGSPLPGALTLEGFANRWRCDASTTHAEGEPLVVLHLRSSDESARRFRALNDQITRLQSEMRHREALEQERKVLLRREREARLEMEQANRFKDELLASISHELRTPLHAISGWLSLLKSAPDDPERLNRGIEVIERNVRAQNQLIEDLVDTSLTITGRLNLRLQPVDLEQIVQLAVQSATPAIEAKRQRLEVIANVGNCVVHGDPDRLLQIVWNLLSNATKYTPAGGKIQVVLRRVNSHAEIIVSDTGEGIPDDLLPYVFDRFRRADGRTTRRHGGLGLGLAIVRHLAELHGGVVMADSPGPGGGATFTVNLPLPVFAGRRALQSAANLPPASEGEDLSEVHILIVEDHEDSRELLAQILEAHSARVTAVACALDAYAAFRDHDVDIIISDIEMPDEDGFTLMRKLRALETELGRRSVPAIAISAHSIGDAQLHALRTGYQAFMPKPIKPAELVALVRSLLRNSDPGRDA